MSSFWNDATVIAGVNAVAALCNSGQIQIYAGTAPTGPNTAITSQTLLASMTFGATAFATATASAGTVTATANSITSGTAVATGTASFCILVKSGASTPPTASQIVAQGTVGTSGSNLNLSSTSVVSGATVSCSSFTITQSETGS